MALVTMRRLTLVAGLLSTLAALLVVTSTVMGRGARRSGFSGRAELMQAEAAANSGKARTQALWDSYWPGSRSVRARYQRVKAMVERRNKGLNQTADWDPSGKKNLADPIKFCRDSFPPESFFHQEEFHACLDAIGAKKVRLDVGDSKIVTDITGAPAGRYQPDGPDSLSPGSDGWARN